MQAQILPSEIGETRIDAIYTHWGEVTGDTVLVGRCGDLYHRFSPFHSTPEPACSRSLHGEPELLDPADATKTGYTPCWACYEGVASTLAELEESPVEFTPQLENATPSLEFSEETVELSWQAKNVLPLRSLTREVIVTKRTMHAPAGEYTACGRTPPTSRRVETSIVESHRTPCEDCFDVDHMGGE